MPLVLLWTFMVLTGCVAASLAPEELRTTRSWWRTELFRAYAVFQCLIILPISIYSYAFLADWALLYVIDATRVPSWLVLVLFMAQLGTAMSIFSMASRWIRYDNIRRVHTTSGLVGLFMLFFLWFFGDRISVFGTYAQFHGGYGLRPWYNVSHVFHSFWVSALLCLVGFGYWSARVIVSRRRLMG